MVLQTNWDGNAQQRLVTQNQSWISDYFEDMKDHVRPESYQNFPDLSRKDWASAYYAENFERLKEIKAHYDPQNLFRFAHSIPVKS
jgi:FAD/FMN-containing dehydrogenase